MWRCNCLNWARYLHIIMNTHRITVCPDIETISSLNLHKSFYALTLKIKACTEAFMFMNASGLSISNDAKLLNVVFILDFCWKLWKFILNCINSILYRYLNDHKKAARGKKTSEIRGNGILYFVELIWIDLMIYCTKVWISRVVWDRFAFVKQRFERTTLTRLTFEHSWNPKAFANPTLPC